MPREARGLLKYANSHRKPRSRDFFAPVPEMDYPGKSGISTRSRDWTYSYMLEPRQRKLIDFAFFLNYPHFRLGS